MPRRYALWVAGLVITLAGCQSSVSADPSDSAEPSGAPVEGGAARAEITITGGDHAGEYNVLLVDTGCNRDDSFVVGSNAIEGPAGFEGIDITVFDAEEARTGGTENFAMVLSLADGAEPELAPAEGIGIGSLVLEEHEDEETARVTVEGTMDDGSEANVLVECLFVRAF